MRPHYLGDSYDLVKQRLLDSLRDFGPWVTHPMFTEPAPDGFVRALERLLWAPVVSVELLAPETHRPTYFQACHHHGSLFPDPNTGIRLNGTHDPDYLNLADVLQLVGTRPNELTVVFDQSLQRGNEALQVNGKLGTLANHGIFGFAYVSHAAFLFLSQHTPLLQAARAQILASSRVPESRVTPVQQP